MPQPQFSKLIFVSTIKQYNKVEITGIHYRSVILHYDIDIFVGIRCFWWKSGTMHPLRSPERASSFLRGEGGIIYIGGGGF